MEGLNLKHCQLYTEIFKEKYAEYVHQKLVPDLYLVLVNSRKYSQCI